MRDLFEGGRREENRKEGRKDRAPWPRLDPGIETLALDFSMFLGCFSPSSSLDTPWEGLGFCRSDRHGIHQICSGSRSFSGNRSWFWIFDNRKAEDDGRWRLGLDFVWNPGRRSLDPSLLKMPECYTSWLEIRFMVSG